MSTDVYIGLIGNDPRVVADTRELAAKYARIWADQHERRDAPIYIVGGTYYQTEQ